MSRLVANLWEEVQRASVRHRGTTILRTPLIESPGIAAAAAKLMPEGSAPPRVFLKLESEQITGSFKARGAMNKTKALLERGCKGMCTASTGNHGLACAHAFAETGAATAMRTEIVLPETVNESKLRRLQATGVATKLHGKDCVMAEGYAKKSAEEAGLVYVSPYNDPEIIGGQGTAGLELVDQMRELTGKGPDTVYVPVGGGGLISGIAVAVSKLFPDAEVVGAAPEVNACMKESMEKGRLLTEEEFDGSRPTLSSGTAGGIEPGSITFDVCMELCKRQETVSEEAIAAGVRMVFTEHRKVVEGAAGCGVAAFLADAAQHAGKSVVIVLCGANVDDSDLRSMLQWA